LFHISLPRVDKNDCLRLNYAEGDNAQLMQSEQLFEATQYLFV